MRRWIDRVEKEKNTMLGQRIRDAEDQTKWGKRAKNTTLSVTNFWQERAGKIYRKYLTGHELLTLSGVGGKVTKIDKTKWANIIEFHNSIPQTYWIYIVWTGFIMLLERWISSIQYKFIRREVSCLSHLTSAVLAILFFTSARCIPTLMLISFSLAAFPCKHTQFAIISVSYQAFLVQIFSL